MKLPYKWLNDFTPVDVDVRTFAARMTMTGSKVEGFENAADNIKNVVCGRICDIKKHEKSDHLLICMLDVGASEQVQIITGAPNVKVGQLVPVALDDATLPGGIEIKTTSMRGELSRGMLCSMGELALTEHDCPYGDPEGILVLEEGMGKPGDDICTVLGLDEYVVEFEITPNRPDCLSVIGLAREAAASFSDSFSVPELKNYSTEGDISEHLSVSISAPDLCSRYAAAMVKDIKIAPSPQWMRDRLRAAGVRPINNIVDITNYVMLEYGQPMHAFDYACIEQDKIVVRKSLDGETCTTLDGQVRQLAPDTLVITDPKKIVGIAGVMGGENSEITENTKMIVFESATFSGPSIRVSSRKIGMRTEASGRFEKGLDSENAMPALLRALELVDTLGAGTVIGGIIDEYPGKKSMGKLKLEPERTRDFIGAPIDTEDMKKYLRALGFKVEGDSISVPTWRDDIEGFADIAEEIARLYGFDKIPSTLYSGAAAIGGFTKRQSFERLVDEACFAAGFSEAKTLTFMSEKAFDKIGLSSDDPRRNAIVISNPLGEDHSLMRTTSLPAMLDAVARNFNYRTSELALFERCTLYTPKAEGLAHEHKALVMAMYGKGDFFALKGFVQSILEHLSVKAPKILPCSDNPSYHPGRCAALLCQNGETLGYIGQLHPAVAAQYGIETEVYIAELSLELMFDTISDTPIYTPLPKYPAMTRDIAILCDDDIYTQQLEDTIIGAAGPALESVKLFDYYKGKQTPEGKKSLAFALSFRLSDRTMTDGEADEAMSAILKQLDKQHGATLRA